ncbi:hypothetical protein [Pseudomonas matsuisoli]|uniref:Uncharacterized protein n=1 Tax=Pseudomonas matsuisoli TaxID=1515666 RepID=A0A917Q166_9PSED|nr:hypothetical protein [Pseudomonas matsuisoli]GGK04996.1 hypothetical protein GCM10009304_33820 [Pseudomonas matsuisoli]
MSDSVTLTLHRRTRAPTPDSLHLRELELHLSEDGRDPVLRRYAERYHEDRVGWKAAHEHRVSLAEVVRWMVDKGREARAPST